MPNDNPDIRFMARAIELAKRGEGAVSPNPLVGAVIAREGRVLGEGWHRANGGPHAEAEAVADALRRGHGDLTGSTLYCNLEPCAYRSPEKRQPPCTELIARHGFSRAVIACRDPNPRVNGAGMAALRAAGMSVDEGVLADRARRLDEAYFFSVERGRPFVHLKAAQSLDGRLATDTGDSKWITDDAARRAARRLRSKYDAVLVGSGTVRADDPELTTRLAGKRDPLRVVLASNLDLPLSARLLRPEFAPGLVIFRAASVDDSREGSSDDPGEGLRESSPIAEASTRESSPRLGGAKSAPSDAAATKLEERERRLTDAGARVIAVNRGVDGGLDLRAVLARLDALGVRSVLVEGGSRVITAFIRAGLYQKITIFTAPMLIGGNRNAIGDLSVTAIANAPRLRDVRYERIGDQIAATGYAEEQPCSRD